MIIMHNNRIKEITCKMSTNIIALGGCSLSLLFHNVRSARGGGLELLEGEMRRWGVAWDAVELAET